MRGVDWTKTPAFMVPSGDCGYLRLNLSGRERDGIVDPKDAVQVMDRIASGLLSFRDPDGRPAVKHVQVVSQSFQERSLASPLPDLIVHWSEHLPPHLAGVSSPQFGDVPSTGWGSGRTGEHRNEGWALIIPGFSKITTPKNLPHILDIAPTICAVLGVPHEGLVGQPLLKPAPQLTQDNGGIERRHE
jgi:predicted AlkP superfamily phosphohydrolase/phosphomutase